MEDRTLLERLLAQERAALDCWSRGDTLAYAERLADNATYFDHATSERLQGLPAIRKHVSAFQDKINIPRHEIINPVMHRSGDLAALAFNWDPYGPDGKRVMRWNATSVYRRIGDEWRIVHTQWAIAADGG